MVCGQILQLIQPQYGWLFGPKGLKPSKPNHIPRPQYDLAPYAWPFCQQHNTLLLYSSPPINNKGYITYLMLRSTGTKAVVSHKTFFQKEKTPAGEGAGAAVDPLGRRVRGGRRGLTV